MPEELKYITASCSINKGVIRKNNKAVFENDTTITQDFLLSIYRHFKIDYPKFHKMDSLSKLGFLATEILLDGSIVGRNYKPENVNLVFANANASLDADLNYWQTVKNIASPALFVYTLPNIVIGEICIRNKFKGENAFFIQEKFDTAFLHFYVNDLVDRYKPGMTICGWIDILGDDYKTVLYLVETVREDHDRPFTIENINNIYESAMDKLMYKLKEQIIQQLNLKDLKPEDIGDDQPLFVEGLGLDSIDALELIVLLQQEYKIKLANAEDGQKVFRSVRTMAQYITEFQPKQA